MGQPSSEDMASVATPRATVLVVDDEPTIRRIVTWVLRRRGFEVVEAVDGMGGLERFNEHGNIDLVLSDIVMPELDGVGMVRELRRHQPAVPVLFMSGYAGHDCPELDDDDLRLLLSKPFTPDQLVARIEQALATKP